MTHKFIPPHLRKFIVEQNYEKYTAIDHAVWRFIMRISKAFFKMHAHSSYLEGLEKTGITTDRIPQVDEMDRKLSRFGWGAVCVRGFIPPSAFMELQSLGILAIAADMRTLEHLTYTPAPDIVHEAAGHAPIIADPDYAAYLHHYGEVASKAISSNEDMDLYRAIRDLSDVKEDSSSTPQDIQTSEESLRKAIDSITYVSEAAYLARMNWWTVEYGLVGNIDDPKIYGAGLLSSVSESQNCLTDKVKKIPFSLDCINTSYDITEPQPQLFVTPDFRELSVVLEQMADKMAFRNGGLVGLQKAKEAQTVCTAEYESKIQISGILTNIIKDKGGKPAYLQYTGPTQLSRFGNQLKGHGGDYHKEGFGSPVGKVKGLNKPISDFNDDDISKINLFASQSVFIEFESGVTVVGDINRILQDNGRFLIISFENCTVKHGKTVLFMSEWGTFDMTCGGYIKSVYGGPADFDHYQEFLPEESPIIEEMSSKVNLSDSKTTLNALYSKVREYREKNTIDYKRLYKLYQTVRNENPEDWLLAMEILELITEENSVQKIQSYLQDRYPNSSDLNHVIKRGLELV